MCWRAKRYIQSCSAGQVTICLSNLIEVRHHNHIRYTTHWSIRPLRCSARLVWQQWPYSDPACWGRRRKTVQKHQVQRASSPTTVSSRTQQSQLYSLRPRRHNFILATKTDERNFVTRQLFVNIYWTLLCYCNSVGLLVRFLYFLYLCFYIHRCTQLCSVQLKIKYWLIDWLIDEQNGSMFELSSYAW